MNKVICIQCQKEWVPTPDEDYYPEKGMCEPCFLISVGMGDKPFVTVELITVQLPDDLL